jgi:hypothetical protein
MIVRPSFREGLVAPGRGFAVQEIMNVQYMELLTRAKEVEAPLDEPPKEDPGPPCDLWFVTKPTKALADTAANIRQYLDYGRLERQKLAESLRNAARAYAEVDEDAKQAIDTDNGSVLGGEG